MAANEPDAATGFVEGSGVNTSPGQDFTASAIATSPTRHFTCADTRSRFGARDTWMCSGVEIMGLIEIGEETRLLRRPSQRRSGPRARGGNVHARENGEPAAMTRRLLTGPGGGP